MTALSECRGSLLTAIKFSQSEISQREKRRGDTWPAYDRDFHAYMVDFSHVVNEAVLFMQLERIQSPVIIDFMSSTYAIASLLVDLGNKDGLGIAVGRKDNRDIFQKRRDESLGIHQIAGDLLQGRVWAETRKLLSGRKANLILEDGALAWDFIPNNRGLYGLMLNRTWDLLSSEGGVLLAEIPTTEELVSAEVSMTEWRDMLLRDGIDFEYANLELNKVGLLRLRKTPDSPISLPQLA